VGNSRNTVGATGKAKLVPANTATDLARPRPEEVAVVADRMAVTRQSRGKQLFGMRNCNLSPPPASEIPTPIRPRCLPSLLTAMPRIPRYASPLTCRHERNVLVSPCLLRSAPKRCVLHARYMWGWHQPAPHARNALAGDQPRRAK